MNTSKYSFKSIFTLLTFIFIASCTPLEEPEGTQVIEATEINEQISNLTTIDSSELNNTEESYGETPPEEVLLEEEEPANIEPASIPKEPDSEITDKSVKLEALMGSYKKEEITREEFDSQRKVILGL